MQCVAGQIVIEGIPRGSVGGPTAWAIIFAIWCARLGILRT
ncbi:hypothetical protein BSLA_01r3065 [Burkholderia stabilis]|nr:hypothetical protein BSLA_01r3065 [Burkholderia stabilis]